MRRHIIYFVMLFLLSVFFVFSGCNMSQQTLQPNSVEELKEIQLDDKTKTELNTFFSNFSEVFLEPFEEGKISNQELIRFGVLHNYINNDGLIKHYYENYGSIEAEYIEKSVEKYFGHTIEHHESITISEFKDGYYIIPYADGEATVFSQVERLFEVGNDLYAAYVKDYYASNWWSGDPHATIKEWKEYDSEDIPQLSRKIKAKIRKLMLDGNSRYVLLECTVVERFDD